MANMFIVSCREDFWSTTDFSGGLDIRDLDMTGDGSGAVRHIRQLPAGDRRQARDGARPRLQQRSPRRARFVRHDRAPHAPAEFSRRRQRALRRRHRLRHGPADRCVCRSRSRAPAPTNPRRTSRVCSAICAARMRPSISTRHSLGAHVTFEALRDVPANTVRTAWNFASAVDNESVEDGERYFTASQGCSTFYVFHSKNDPVLRIWYRIGDFVRLRHGARLLGIPRIRVRSSIAPRTSASSTARTSSRRTRLPVGGRGVVVHGAGTGCADDLAVHDADEDDRGAAGRVQGERRQCESMRMAAASGTGAGCRVEEEEGGGGAARDRSGARNPRCRAERSRKRA